MKNKLPHPKENAYYLQLWQNARLGDREAFCRLGEDHYVSLFNYATNFTSDRELIKDTIQDLYLHLWENRMKINMEIVSIYLLRAIRNNILQTYRRASAHPVLPETYLLSGTDGHTPEREIISRETAVANNARIKKAILDLPERQKEVIFLKYYQGLENEQIASLINVNRQSVANLLYKALITLRKQLPHLVNIIVITLWFSGGYLFFR